MKTNFNSLEEIDKTNPFKVPENYFAQLNEEIMNRLPEKKLPEPKNIPLWDKVKPWVYMAAMFVGLFFTIEFLTRNDERAKAIRTVSSQQESINRQNQKYWSNLQVTEEEFYQYLEDQVTEDGFYDYVYDTMYSNQDM